MFINEGGSSRSGALSRTRGSPGRRGGRDRIQGRRVRDLYFYLCEQAAYPTQFSLPDGFQPEGIAIGPGPSAYFGSRGTGAIYRVSLRTGQGKIINSGPGTPSLGLKVDSRDRLFVAAAPAATPA
ncbi:hypothetical protein ACFQX6_42100 [Streptosporangium lutulentum]